MKLYLTIAEHDGSTTACQTFFFDDSEEQRLKMAEVATMWGIDGSYCVGTQEMPFEEMGHGSLDSVMRQWLKQNENYDFTHGYVPD